jgi:sterol desaturase/sphingolipid hydroxylase (fatty acid hydroxylase superfamily)
VILVFTFAAISVALLWEMLLPRRKLQQPLAWRWSNNFALSLISQSIATAASVALVSGVSDWTQVNEFGLFQRVDAPAPLVFLVLLLATQLALYLMHVAYHRYAWLWPIHAVHHTDVDVDVTTSYRHHPLEALIAVIVISPLVLLLGIPTDVAIAYSLFLIAVTLFSHSNIRLPQTLDRVLRIFIVTPEFHRLHHCAESRYTNSNYGPVVPWFDYLFGTASTRPYEDHETMQLGLEYLREPADSRVDKLLWEPVLVRNLLAAGEERRR